MCQPVFVHGLQLVVEYGNTTFSCTRPHRATLFHANITSEYVVLTSYERQTLELSNLCVVLEAMKWIKLASFAFQAFDDGDEPSGSIAVGPFLTS